MSDTYDLYAHGPASPPAPSGAGRRVVGLALTALFVVMALAGPAKVLWRSDGGSAPGEVRMAGLRFAPASLAVGRADEVVFRNDDVAPHTVTAADGSLDSGILAPGDTFAVSVNEPLDYVCAIHPDMVGRIELEG